MPVFARQAAAASAVQSVIEPFRVEIPRRWAQIAAAGFTFLLVAALAKGYIATLGPSLDQYPVSETVRAAWRITLSRLVPWLLWIPLTPVIGWFAATVKRAGPFWAVAALHAVASIAIATLHIAATVAINVQLLDPALSQFVPRFFARFYVLDGEVLVYWVILGAAYAFHFVTRSQQSELRSVPPEGQATADPRAVSPSLDGDMSALETRPQYLFRIAIREDGRVRFVRADDVDYIESDRNYVWLHVGSRSHRIRTSLRQFAEGLDPRYFARIHKSTIVNLDRVAEVQPWFGGDHVAIMRDGKQLRVSRTYAAGLLHGSAGQ
jgi:hypothetical protein